MRPSAGRRPAAGVAAPDPRERLARQRPVPEVDREPSPRVLAAAFLGRGVVPKVVGLAFEGPPALAGPLCDEPRRFPDAAVRGRRHQSRTLLLVVAAPGRRRSRDAHGPCRSSATSWR